MTELKTLEDIWEEWYEETTERNYKAIKQEAIKWVKENLENPSPLYNKNKEPWMSNTKPIIEWIVHFFNLTEEDLR